MSANILSLEALALNILKNSFSEKIAESVDVPELDPCSLCNQELFLYEIKNPITILICGHIYHRDCIENSIKKHSICPRPDCKKEVKEAKSQDYVLSMVDATSGSQNTNDSMDISPALSTAYFPSLLQYSSLPEKRVSEFTSKSSSKKVKKHVSKEDSPILKKLIEELTSTIPENSKKAIEVNESTNNFLYHYNKIMQTESKASREVIESYFNFGEAMKKRFDHYKNLKHGDRACLALVNDEIRQQLPDNITNDALKKRKERAGKIYGLFVSIGKEKIRGIRSFSASNISNLSQENIDYVIVEVLKKENRI